MAAPLSRRPSSSSARNPPPARAPNNSPEVPPRRRGQGEGFSHVGQEPASLRNSRSPSMRDNIREGQSYQPRPAPRETSPPRPRHRLAPQYHRATAAAAGDTTRRRTIACHRSSTADRRPAAHGRPGLRQWWRRALSASSPPGRTARALGQFAAAPAGPGDDFNPGNE